MDSWFIELIRAIPEKPGVFGLDQLEKKSSILLLEMKNTMVFYNQF